MKTNVLLGCSSAETEIRIISLIIVSISPGQNQLSVFSHILKMIMFLTHKTLKRENNEVQETLLIMLVCFEDGRDKDGFMSNQRTFLTRPQEGEAVQLCCGNMLQLLALSVSQVKAGPRQPPWFWF